MNKRLFTSAIVTLSVFFTLSSQNSNIEDALRRHVEILASDSLEGRGFGFPSKKLTIDYLTREFTLSGFMPLKDNFKQTFISGGNVMMVEGVNIIGLIEGSDPVLKNEYIIIGAHYDHLGWKMTDGKKIIYNGADDNASGVAAMIEIGKSLISKKMNLKRSVIIAAFDGEEAGLLGSSSFITNKIIEPSKIKTMFSLDMIGMYNKNEGLNLNGINSIKNGENISKDIAAPEDITIKKTENKIEPRTDTWPFAKYYIPSIYVTTGLISPYHKPEDDSNLLDYPGMTKIVNLMSSLVFEIANNDSTETNRRFISHSIDPKFRMGYIVNFGNNYHYYKNDFFNAKTVFAVETGITSQLKISKYFYLQPAVTYEMTGSHTESGILRMHSVSPQVDILLSGSESKGDKTIGFIVLGGYYRYNFAATKSGDSFNFAEEYVRQEVGIKSGIGLQYQSFQMTFVRKIGLDKINLDNLQGKIYNRSSYLSLVKFF